MKAVILCAGQGRRLLPYTESTPKCLLPLGNKYFIEWQVDTLISTGIEQIIAVTGYDAPRVESILVKRYGKKIQTVFNPFYEIADNLASCWMARDHFHGEFILVNGDTLFEPAIITQLMRNSSDPVVLVSDYKNEYDDDDMKIICEQSKLVKIGKNLPLDKVNGESIGMIRFSDAGADLFREKVEQSMLNQEALQKWYLSVIDELAQNNLVSTCSVHGKDWVELDYAQDLEQAQELIEKWQQLPNVARM